jgi:hypothetical protein
MSRQARTRFAKRRVYFAPAIPKTYHQRQQDVYVAMSQVLHVTIARCGSSNSTHSGLRCGCCGGYHNGSDAPCRWHRRHQSPRRQWQCRRGAGRAGAPKGNGCSRHTQYRGSGLALPHHKPAGDCLASGDSDNETDEFTLDAAAVVAEEAVERKEARRVKPWLSELDGYRSGRSWRGTGWGGGRC